MTQFQDQQNQYQQNRNAMPRGQQSQVDPNDPLRFYPIFTPARDEPDPIEIIDLDSGRTAVKEHTWGS